MTKRRDLKLKDDFGISNKRYRELYYFCQQYHEWKDELRWNSDTLKSPSLTGMPGSGAISDQTGNHATKRAELSLKCDLIEQTAYEADPVIYPHIIKNVTNEGIGFTYLQTVMNIPCGKDLFYKARRKFFYLLDKKK